MGSWLIWNLLVPKEPSKKLFEEIRVKVMSKHHHSNLCQSYSAYDKLSSHREGESVAKFLVELKFKVV